MEQRLRLSGLPFVSTPVPVFQGRALPGVSPSAKDTTVPVFRGGLVKIGLFMTIYLIVALAVILLLLKFPGSIPVYGLVIALILVPSALRVRRARARDRARRAAASRSRSGR